MVETSIVLGTPVRRIGPEQCHPHLVSVRDMRPVQRASRAKDTGRMTRETETTFCKGDIRLGSGCGKCRRCLDQIAAGHKPPDRERASSITNRRFSEWAGRMAVRAAGWASDTLTLPEAVNKPMPADQVARFIADMRGMLDAMEVASHE